MRKFLLAYALLQSIVLTAQNDIDLSLSSDFRQEVKSLEEFMERFNGRESKPGIAKDENFRRNNLISLFDFQMDKKGLSKVDFSHQVESFVNTVLSSNVKFCITGAGLWAECLCRMQYKGKDVKITLVLQNEQYKEGLYRWTIVAVRGLEELIQTEKYYVISPTEHEIHFVGLQDCLNANPSQAFGYRPHGAGIDMLSVFLTMVHERTLKYDIVERQTFHFYDIPDYIIEINEISRQGMNSGWLITSFRQVTSTEKKENLNKLLGYEKD